MPSLVPEGEMELAIANTQRGIQSIHDVIELFLRSKVFVPSGTSISEIGEGLTPLQFDREHETMVAAFCSPERALKFGDLAPYGVLMYGRDLVKWMEDGLGIVVNPGWEIGFEIPVAGVRKLREYLLKK
jgi:hypothetical protein